MSYEGYVVQLCKNGHCTKDAHDHEETKCDVCGEELVVSGWSEYGNFEETELDNVQKVAGKPCSDICTEYSLMKDTLTSVWYEYVEKEATQVTATARVITDFLRTHFEFVSDMIDKEKTK